MFPRWSRMVLLEKPSARSRRTCSCHDFFILKWAFSISLFFVTLPFSKTCETLLNLDVSVPSELDSGQAIVQEHHTRDVSLSACLMRTRVGSSGFIAGGGNADRLAIGCVCLVVPFLSRAVPCVVELVRARGLPCLTFDPDGNACRRTLILGLWCRCWPG